jgi:sulfate transport system substrate-binding protein
MPWNGLFSLPMAVAITLGVVALQAGEKALTMLNVSYDPTRELYQDLDTAFAQKWKEQTGQVVTINQSHGRSGKQA